MKKYILTSFFGLLFNSCNIKGYDEIYLIPKGYVGEVIIVFNQKGKTKVEIKDDIVIYTIPNDGILLTEYTENGSYVNDIYFYVDSLGNKSRLKRFYKEFEGNDLGIYGGAVGTLDNNLQFYSFFVGTKLDREENHKFDPDGWKFSKQVIYKAKK